MFKLLVIMSLFVICSCSKSIPSNAYLKLKIDDLCRKAYERVAYDEGYKYQECQKNERDNIIKTIQYSTGLKTTSCSYDMKKAEENYGKCSSFFQSEPKFKIGQIVNLKKVGLKDYSEDCYGVITRVFWSNGYIFDKPAAKVQISCTNLDERFEDSFNF